MFLLKAWVREDVECEKQVPTVFRKTCKLNVGKGAGFVWPHERNNELAIAKRSRCWVWCNCIVQGDQ